MAGRARRVVRRVGDEFAGPSSKLSSERRDRREIPPRGLGGSRRSGSAPAGAADSCHGRPAATRTPPAVAASLFAPQGFAFADVTEVATAGGPLKTLVLKVLMLKVLMLKMRAASLGDCRLRTRDGPGCDRHRRTAAGGLAIPVRAAPPVAVRASRPG